MVVKALPSRLMLMSVCSGSGMLELVVDAVVDTLNRLRPDSDIKV